MIAFSLLFLLSACVDSQTTNQAIVEKVMKDAMVKEIPTFVNIDKEYYSYYLPFDVGRKSSDEISNIFYYQKAIFLMCVNIPVIVKDHYYSETITDNTPSVIDQQGLEKYLGNFLDYNNVNISYEVTLMELSDNNYYLQLLTPHLSFGSMVSKAQIEPILQTMIEIARTTRISFELIASDFSNREVISSATSQTVDFFQQQLPDSGYIIDLLNPINPFKDLDVESATR